MTDKLYTQSDMEALRERCAKVVLESYYGSGHPKELERLHYNMGAKDSLENAARKLRLMPLTLHPEGEKP